MRKKIVLSIITTLFATSMVGCSTINEIKEIFKPTRPTIEELYAVDDDFNAMTPVGTNIYESSNYILTLTSQDYVIKPERSANITCSYDWINGTNKTMLRVGFFIYENLVEYDIPTYEELPDISIGDKTYKIYEQKNNGYSLLYKNDNNSYLKIELYPLQTINMEDQSILDLQVLDETLFIDDGFNEIMNFTIELKEGATIKQNNGPIILIKPETEFEVNYTEDEVKIIYTLIYSDEMSREAVECLNKVGVYGIKSATLEPSNSGYLVNVLTKEKARYFVYIDMNKHTYAIQKDSIDGEYLYLEETNQ